MVDPSADAFLPTSRLVQASASIAVAPTVRANVIVVMKCLISCSFFISIIRYFVTV